MRKLERLKGLPLDKSKFLDPRVTRTGEKRASVSLKYLKTLWFNTGTLCNLQCVNCYIESSPLNDSLVYITSSEVEVFLRELDKNDNVLEEVAFTGGEPFMNPELLHMAEISLKHDYRVLILTNAMRPMMKCVDGLLDLKERFGTKMVLRVSLDYYSRTRHDLFRGKHAFDSAIEGLLWLVRNEFKIKLAGRKLWDENEELLRNGFAKLCSLNRIPIDVYNPDELVLFPEMDETLDVPEITDQCWSKLNVDPNNIMCAFSRMIVKRKGETKPVVLPCTLLPYEKRFELGHSLHEALVDVPLNHPHCSRFCVLGSGCCS